MPEYFRRISKAFENALCLPLESYSKYVIFSDCHRGTGTANDNFLKNELLYLAALKHYFQTDFTYLGLGDGDELWENRSFDAIKQMHPDSFKILSDFHRNGRFFSVYGNHDITKRQSKFSETHCHSYFCQQQLCHRPLFPYITFYPAIILKDERKKKDIYLIHGHQADFLNSTLWPLSRFLVRYIWRPLELLGIQDPTSAAKNYRKKKISEKCLVYLGGTASSYFNFRTHTSPDDRSRQITLFQYWKLCIPIRNYMHRNRKSMHFPCEMELENRSSATCICCQKYIGKNCVY